MATYHAVPLIICLILIVATTSGCATISQEEAVCRSVTRIPVSDSELQHLGPETARAILGHNRLVAAKCNR